MKENICKYFILFRETNKWFICCHVQINSFSIYLSNFANDIFKQFIVFANKDGFKVGRKEKIGISEQDALNKIK